MRGDDRMMSILTGLLLVVVLGAIVQKSDALMDAFSDFTGETEEEASAAPEPEEAPRDSKPAAQSTDEARGEAPAPAAPEAVAAAPPDVTRYRAQLDEVTIEAGGTYSIDVLGNDVGVGPETYGKLKLLASTTTCGIVRLIDGRVGYYADEQCIGAHHIFYCIEGAAADQCEEGVLNIFVVSPKSATLDPANFLRDVSPNTDGLQLPDRAPKVDISVTAPVVSDRPAPSPSVRAPPPAGAAAPRVPSSDGLWRDAGVRIRNPDAEGLFGSPISGDPLPPAADGDVRKPNRVAAVEPRTEADPLVGPVRADDAVGGSTLAPVPLAKPSRVDPSAADQPKIAGTGVLQSLASIDAEAPSGGALAERVEMRDVGKVELLVRRADGARPPDTRRSASTLAPPEAGGAAPEIAGMSASDGPRTQASELQRTEYVSVASLSPAEAGAEVAINPTSRLPDAGAPLTMDVGKLSGAAPQERAPGMELARVEDAAISERAGAILSDAAAVRPDAAAGHGEFILRDKPAKAIPREALAIDPGVASSDAPHIEAVETAALDMVQPAELSANGEPSAEERGIEIAAVDPNASDAISPAEPRAPPKKADCAIEVSAVAVRGALIRVEASSPCRAGQVARFAHHGLEFASRFDAGGAAELLLPALDRHAVVLARAEDGEEAYARVSVPGMGRLSRLALIWKDDVDLNLHAFEYGAAIGAQGHVWEGAPTDLTNYKRGRAGLLLAFHPIDGYGDRVEIYSFAPGRRSASGSVEFAIQFASRGRTPAQPHCGGGALAAPRYTILRIENGKLGAPIEGAIDAAPCGARLSEAAEYRRGLVNDVVVSR